MLQGADLLLHTPSSVHPRVLPRPDHQIYLAAGVSPVARRVAGGLHADPADCDDVLGGDIHAGGL